MPEHDAVAALIDRIVAGARVPSRAHRDDLRRELWTHFEEANTSPEALHRAIRRFGDESLVSASLRDVYRLEYAAAYLAKLAVSAVASVAAALAIEVLVNLRVEAHTEVLRLGPGFSRAVGVAVAFVLGLVGAWEIIRPPLSATRAALVLGAYAAICLSAHWFLAAPTGAFVTPTMLVVAGYVCSRVATPPSRLLLAIGAFAAVLYGNHRVLGVVFGPRRALLAGLVLVAVWSTTVLILGRVDHAFADRLESGSHEPV
jgi:hypothetical protein